MFLAIGLSLLLLVFVYWYFSRDSVENMCSCSLGGVALADTSREEKSQMSAMGTFPSEYRGVF